VFSELNNKDIVKKKLRLKSSFVVVLELVKQLRLALRLNLKLTKDQELQLIKEIESIFCNNLN
jgi:hypothetical protein